MYSNKPINYREDRRRKPDFICSWLEVSVAVVWFVLFMIVLLFQKALPREKTFFDRLFSVELQETLDYTYLTPVLYLLILLLVLSTVSLILNFRRLKRSTDHIRISFIISIVFSVMGLVYLLIRF
jgi:glucan phosphoethanolaminetransferase (alkaline phosphatase superfamily)